MPSLYDQIGTLYQVIGQIEPASEARRADAHPSLGSIAARWLCAGYCLWFSVSLSTRLSKSRAGVALYWRCLSLTARLVEKFTCKQQPGAEAVAAGKLAAEFCPLEGAAQ